MKKCPFCAEEIQDEAIKCRFCGSMLADAGGATAQQPPITEAVDEEVRRLAQGNRKIEAIKLIREKKGLGLKQAKEYVEALEKGNMPPQFAAGTSANAAGPGATQKGCLGCLGVVVLLAGIGWLFGSSDSPRSGSSDHSVMAFVHCKDFVRARLRAPSTADFPFLDRQVTSPAAGTFVVVSYVDAQNAFGAMIRNNYRCTVRYKGGEEAAQASWDLVDLQMAVP